MKKILFSAFCNNISHINIVKGLADMIVSKGNQIDVMTNIDLGVDLQSIHTINTEDTVPKYDLIFAFNLKGLNRIKKYQKKNIPIIYVLCSRDIEDEYLYESDKFDKILLINNDINFYPHLLPDEYTIPINIPSELVRDISLKKDYSDNILVCLNYEILLKFISTLNRILKYNIKIITDKPNKIKKLVNVNIQVIEQVDTMLDEYIKNTSLVISNGDIILKSLQFSKPSIVIGQYGFGRLLTSSQFAQQYLSGFNGRIGANMNELLPLKLIEFEIHRTMDLIASSSCETEELIDNFTNEFDLTSQIIEKLINEVCIQKSEYWNSYYKLGTVYFYIKKSENKYIVIDRRVNKVFSIINDDEYNIVKLFANSSTPKNIYNSLESIDEKEFKKFIQQLILNKMIVYNGNL